MYAFLRKHYAAAALLWNTVREELKAFAGLMIFLQNDWWLQWNDHVLQSDSSLGGLGPVPLADRQAACHSPCAPRVRGGSGRAQASRKLVAQRRTQSTRLPP